eukprot:GHVP01063325.1.p1 GENE.GHVP01063325.1~~GHVP01063325.1.p1  ORF type:complete len:231 (-),score=45.63 GHVP01063325.1:1486-2178(-)
MVTLKDLVEKLPHQLSKFAPDVKKAFEIVNDDPILSYTIIYNLTLKSAEMGDLDTSDYFEDLEKYILQVEDDLMVTMESSVEHTTKLADQYFVNAKKVEDTNYRDAVRMYKESIYCYGLLSSIEELPNEIKVRRKYAKWKIIELIKLSKKPKIDETAITDIPSNQPSVLGLNKELEEEDPELEYNYLQSIKEAGNLCKKALSCMEYQDIETALVYLEETISYLNNIKQNR